MQSSPAKFMRLDGHCSEGAMFICKVLSRSHHWMVLYVHTCTYAYAYKGFPCGSAGKESTCSAGDLGSIPGLRRSPGEGKGYPLQYSGLEKSMDCILHGVAKSRTQLFISTYVYTHMCDYIHIHKYVYTMTRE